MSRSDARYGPKRGLTIAAKAEPKALLDSEFHPRLEVALQLTKRRNTSSGEAFRRGNDNWTSGPGLRARHQHVDVRIRTIPHVIRERELFAQILRMTTTIRAIQEHLQYGCHQPDDTDVRRFLHDAHACRSAFIGSRAAARRAGNSDARTATPISTTGAMANATGSSVVTP